MTKRIVSFAPEDAGSAARFLAECTRLAFDGHNVSVRISPESSENDLGTGERVAGEKDLADMASGGIDVLISFSNLSGILETSPSDMLIRAKGGTPVSTISVVAEESLLWFPHHDSSMAREMNIASLIMELPVLPMSEAFGGLREYILSVEMVTGGGEMVHFGSKAVKDVAGYEVIGLLLGGGGRYGMITEVTLRLIPRPVDIEAGKVATFIKEKSDEGPLESMVERVSKVFDPAGILR